MNGTVREMNGVVIEGIDQVYVKLMQRPEGDPIDLMFAMAKKSVKIDEPLYTPEYLGKFTRAEKIAFLKKVVFGAGHKGILEHPCYSFEVWGVSRSMTHQAVRNRIASFLEGSLRYIDPTIGVFKYIVPMSLRGDDPKLIALREEYAMDMAHSANLYKKWFNIGKELGLPKNKCQELGRTTLPHSTCTTYGFTMNVASLVLVANKRECERAEEEYKSAAGPIMDILREELHGFLDDLGPMCKMYGYCPEGDFCCGKAPTLKQLITHYNQ